MSNGKLVVAFIVLFLVSGCLNYDDDIEETKTKVVDGCMDESAENYDSNATNDDGTCSYRYFCEDSDGDDVCDEYEISGCTDEAAENYDSNATDDDETCSYCEDSDGDGVCAEEDACDDNPDASTKDECETEDL
mgnify:CR=1 FL=1